MHDSAIRRSRLRLVPDPAEDRGMDEREFAIVTTVLREARDALKGWVGRLPEGSSWHRAFSRALAAVEKALERTQ